MHERLVAAANGFLDMGKPQEAWAELEQVPPDKQKESIVMRVRIDVCYFLEKWELMEQLTREMAARESWTPQHARNLATCLGSQGRDEEAVEVLERLVEAHPQDPLTRYNLACYLCRIGRIEAGRAMLQTAFKLDKALKDPAKTDPDLSALYKKSR